jgi:hypothetical protein
MGMPPGANMAGGPFSQMFEAWLGGTPPAAKTERETR